MRLNHLMMLVVGGALLTTAQLAAAADEAPVVTHCLVSLIDEAQVPAQEAGVMISVLAHEGQVVAKGDLLAQIDDAQVQFEKRKAVAEQQTAAEKAKNDIDVRYAKAAADVAYVEWQKSEEANIKVPGSVVEVERNRLKLTYRRAELQIEQAQLELKLSGMAVEEKSAEVGAADEAIRRRQIRAPLAGVVVQVVPHVGEWVKPGDPVLRIVHMDRLRVEGFFKSAQYGPEQINGRPVTVSVELPNQAQPLLFTGRIAFVSPTAEAGGEYRIWAEVQNRLVPGRTDAWQLPPGVTATMRIEMN